MIVSSVSISLLAVMSAVASAAATGASVPVIEGPITGGSRGFPFNTYVGNLSAIGYVEEEYFFSGVAARYNIVGGNLTLDGKWTLTENSTAPYKTRILIRRPANAKNSNGDIIVEWINVSGGFDIATADPPGVYEGGYTFAAIDVQAAGISGAGSNPIGLNQWDTQRYGTLNIPDDALSFDIATQAAAVLRSGKVLGGQKINYIIFTGSSQSGTRLNSYINGVQPISNAYDAIIPVIGAGRATAFTADFNRFLPTPAQIRNDLKIPVFTLNSETEAGFYFSGGARQPDTSKYREWEVTGASHANLQVLEVFAAQAQREGIPFPSPPARISQVDWTPTLDAVYRHVSRWLRNTAQPPVFPKINITLSDNGTAVVSRDQNGNALGGVRLPEILVPVAGYNGEDNGLSGSTYPLSNATLKQLYPTHANYVAKISAAAVLALQEGIILDYQAAKYISQATQADVPPN